MRNCLSSIFEIIRLVRETQSTIIKLGLVTLQLDAVPKGSYIIFLIYDISWYSNNAIELSNFFNEPDEDGGGGVDQAADTGRRGRVVVAARRVARTRTLG